MTLAIYDMAYFQNVLAFCSAPGHINNLYNTVFWALVQKGGLTTTQAEDRLKVREEYNKLKGNPP